MSSLDVPPPSENRSRRLVRRCAARTPPWRYPAVRWGFALPLLMLGLLQSACEDADRTATPTNASALASAAATSETPADKAEDDEREAPLSTAEPEDGKYGGAGSTSPPRTGGRGGARKGALEGLGGPPVPEGALAPMPGAQPPGAQPPGAQPPGAQAPGAQAPGAQPPGAQPPGAQPKAALTLPNVQNCVSRCVAANQMKPEGAERIASDCKASCKKSCLSQCDVASAATQNACRADCERQLMRVR